jgi:hypothetical protein
MAVVLEILYITVVSMPRLLPILKKPSPPAFFS